MRAPCCTRAAAVWGWSRVSSAVLSDGVLSGGASVGCRVVYAGIWCLHVSVCVGRRYSGEGTTRHHDTQSYPRETLLRAATLWRHGSTLREDVHGGCGQVVQPSSGSTMRYPERQSPQ